MITKAGRNAMARSMFRDGFGAFFPTMSGRAADLVSKVVYPCTARFVRHSPAFRWCRRDANLQT